MYVCVCMYVCVYIYIYIQLYSVMYIHIHTCRRLYTNTCMVCSYMLHDLMLYCIRAHHLGPSRVGPGSGK